MLIIIWSVVIIAIVTLYFRRLYTRFSRHGVKNFQPIPILGNMGRALFRMEHFSDDVQRTYQTFPEERFVGRFELGNTAVMLRDIELVKKITIKDFEYFLDHRVIIDEHHDPLFGDEWKDMRSTLSPAFTSSKMRLMVPFMVEVGNQMITSMKQKIEASGVGYIDIDGKDLTSRYANDVIASCAFGLKVNSHFEENNEFYRMGKAATTFSFKQILILILFSAVPKRMRKFKFALFSASVRNFFKSLVSNTMQEREAKNIIRPDMIHLLMEAKKGKLSFDEKNDADAGFATVEESAVGKKQIDRVWSDNDLTAQAILFLFAGFDTVSTAMSFLIHELALNPEVQEKLYQEIQENDAKNGGKFDFNSIQKMKYMDMVVSESLRLWPPVIALDRICIKDYNMGKPNDKATEDFILRKGETVNIPGWAFHHDPEYFPNPDKFDPERFSDENKHNIKPFSYMPFGLGPRNCIGSRFALCEVKVMAYQLLQNMEITPCERTQVPTVLAKDDFNLRIKGGHWLRFRLRN